MERSGRRSRAPGRCASASGQGGGSGVADWHRATDRRPRGRFLRSVRGFLPFHPRDNYGADMELPTATDVPRFGG
ncbi:hypothetical protein U9M48_044559 [Paspalum notatum var. saurae]|uniref:Uncharacterized protein n=1 Tax=Paspalum notatum var. saurae TaxID=547442 RepID=A0AAQ3UZL7_PASNO